MSDLIDREAVREFIKSYRHSTDVAFDMEKHLDEIPAVQRWYRVEEPPLPNQDLWLHDERGYYHVGYISTYRGYTEYIDMDGNTLHGIDYWMPIEPPKEDA